MQQRVRAFLEDQWRQHPPFGKSSQYSLLQGERREWFAAPKDLLSRVGADAPPHPFGNLSAVVRWADRCNEWPLVKASRQPIRECFEDFRKSNWKLDRASGDLNANRHLASLLAYVRIAQRAGDAQDARTAKMMADQTADALVQWWNRAGSSSVPRVTANVSEVDRFIGNGDDLFFRLTPHNAKLALFRDLTPEVGALIKARAAQSVDAVWRNFNELCPTWQRIGEERQVHYGENFVDPPDFNFAAFTALTVLRSASFDELSRNIDLPWCKADLYFIAKLAMTLDADPANHD